MRNEQVVETVRVKVTSEKHPDLSPGDQPANFALMDGSPTPRYA